ncbi:MAG: cobalt ABC transporter permease [Geobacteraceae bacterium]|nr:cobalt ABC transporter permease [Geobacteraceae bacterium]
MARIIGIGHRVQSAGSIRRSLAVAVFVSLVTFSLVPLTFCQSASGAETWPGVDESVVEKFASERGREAHSPLINTDQGDLLLFVFLMAGAVGGFAAGYCWRMLLEGKATGPARGQKKRK